MNQRVVVLATAAIGAAVISAAVVVTGSPLGTAEAVPSRALNEPSGLSEMLDEMRPGAVVEKQADGSISVQGQLTAAAQRDARKAAELADSGPNSIRCDGTGATVECTPVRDEEVVPALKSGETLYGRTVYRSIPLTEHAPQLFQVGELNCRNMDGDDTMTCSLVDRVQPVIGADETMFVTYKPYDVTFDKDGAMTSHIAPPTVRLIRAGS